MGYWAPSATVDKTELCADNLAGVGAAYRQAASEEHTVKRSQRKAKFTNPSFQAEQRRGDVLTLLELHVRFRLHKTSFQMSKRLPEGTCSQGVNQFLGSFLIDIFD